MKLEKEEVEKLKLDHEIVFTEKDDYVCPEKSRTFALRINSSNFTEFYTVDRGLGLGSGKYDSSLTGKGFCFVENPGIRIEPNSRHVVTEPIQLYENEWIDRGECFELCLYSDNNKQSKDSYIFNPVVVLKPYGLRYEKFQESSKSIKCYYNLKATLMVNKSTLKEIYLKTTRSKYSFDITFIVSISGLFYSYDCSQGVTENACELYKTPVFMPHDMIHNKTEGSSQTDRYYPEVHGELYQVEIVERLKN